jgi:hypothetical protein
LFSTVIAGSTRAFNESGGIWDPIEAMPIVVNRRFLSLSLALLAVGGSIAGSSVFQGPRVAPKSVSDEDAQAIKEGLVAWRTPGGRLNSACASCHSPDAFDLAQFAFDDATIRRRALSHVNAENATKIVALVHAMRRKYDIDKPLDPMNDRPLQPGVQILPGATSEDRDLAFGRSLIPLMPTLMTGRVNSLEMANKARQEIMSVDPRRLQIGIPINRWSEDIFHGDEHGTVADWLTDLPCAPDPAKQKEWFDIVDQYIAAPTDENLWRIYNAVPDHTVPFTNMPFSKEFAYHKYLAMLVGQQLLRERALGVQDDRRSGPVAFAYLSKGILPNPMWDVGEYAALNEGLDTETQGMPEEVIPTISHKVPFMTEMRAMKAPWLWLGWLQDQGLQRTAGDQNTHNARYFSLALYSDGDYALHNCFMIARKQLVQSFDPAALPEGKAQHFAFDFSEFASHRNAIRYEPQEPERQALFRTMADNAFRMAMYLLIDDAKRTGVVQSKAIDEFQLQSIREYLIYSDPSHKAENVALADRALDVVESSQDANAKATGQG